MVSIQEIILKLDVLDYVGDMDVKVQLPISFDLNNERDDVIMWLNPKNNSILSKLQRGVVICSHVFKTHHNCNYLIVENPRLQFLKLLKFFFTEKRKVGISGNAVIDNSVKMGRNVFIGNNVVIESGCEIGDQVSIDHGTIIKRNTKIRENVSIGCNCVIGAVGFGYETNENNEYEIIPHIGNVVIESNVEIGNGVMIDRAVLESTLIGDNVKIDNLVHIAHGVEIGRNSLIIANSMIAGSVKIGSDTWIAPSSAIRDKVTIGDNALVGLGAVVIKDVNHREVVVGNPAKIISKK